MCEAGVCCLLKLPCRRPKVKFTTVPGPAPGTNGTTNPGTLTCQGVNMAAALTTIPPIFAQSRSAERVHHLIEARQEKQHGYDHSERRYEDLLQGLGLGSASFLPSWLAVERGRLG